MKDWREVIKGSNPTPSAGPLIAAWYQREQPDSEDLLYALAHVLSGTLTEDDFRSKE